MKPRHPILIAFIALLASLASSLTSRATEAILTDDTTVNRAIPHGFYYNQPTLGLAVTQKGVQNIAYLKFQFTNLPAFLETSRAD